MEYRHGTAGSVRELLMLKYMLNVSVSNSDVNIRNKPTSAVLHTATNYRECVGDRVVSDSFMRQFLDNSEPSNRVTKLSQLVRKVSKKIIAFGTSRNKY